MSRESIRIISGRPRCLLEGAVRHFWTTRPGSRGHFLDASDTSTVGVLFRNGSVAAANCLAGAFIDACGFATLMPEEEPESPGEVRSQSKRCLPSVDE
jgi:hypothetical protein